MKRDITVVALLISVLAFGLSVQFAKAHGPRHNPSRHDYITRHRVPAAYEELLNPLRTTSENLSNGQGLYNEHCAVCHGPTGLGDGEGAADLDPAPPSLRGMYARPMAGMDRPGPGAHLMHGSMHHHPGLTHAEAMGGLNLDAYTYWAVSEGGAPMKGSMPAFKEILSARERWQILLYIANGFSVGESR